MFFPNLCEIQYNGYPVNVIDYQHVGVGESTPLRRFNEIASPAQQTDGSLFISPTQVQRDEQIRIEWQRKREYLNLSEPHAFFDLHQSTLQPDRREAQAAQSRSKWRWIEHLGIWVKEEREQTRVPYMSVAQPARLIDKGYYIIDKRGDDYEPVPCPRFLDHMGEDRDAIMRQMPPTRRHNPLKEEPSSRLPLIRPPLPRSHAPPHLLRRTRRKHDSSRMPPLHETLQSMDGDSQTSAGSRAFEHEISSDAAHASSESLNSRNETPSFYSTFVRDGASKLMREQRTPGYPSPPQNSFLISDERTETDTPTSLQSRSMMTEDYNLPPDGEDGRSTPPSRAGVPEPGDGRRKRKIVKKKGKKHRKGSGGNLSPGPPVEGSGSAPPGGLRHQVGLNRSKDPSVFLHVGPTRSGSTTPDEPEFVFGEEGEEKHEDESPVQTKGKRAKPKKKQAKRKVVPRVLVEKAQPSEPPDTARPSFSRATTRSSGEYVLTVATPLRRSRASSRRSARASPTDPSVEQPPDTADGEGEKKVFPVSRESKLLRARGRYSVDDELKAWQQAERRRKMLGELTRIRNMTFSDDDMDDEKLGQREWANWMDQFCILNKRNLMVFRHAFDTLDTGKCGRIDAEAALDALRNVNINLDEKEAEFMLRLADILGYVEDSDDFDFRNFSVLCALSSRITSLDTWIRSLLRECDMKLLELKVYRLQRLWRVLRDSQTNTIPVRSLIVCLRAGKVTF